MSKVPTFKSQGYPKEKRKNKKIENLFDKNNEIKLS